MECDKSWEYMMKYMDGVITPGEAMELRAHMDKCPHCAGDFHVYDEMLSGFRDMEIVEAPPGFEAAVMAKIDLLGEGERKTAKGGENLAAAVLGVLSALFGLGVVVYLNRDWFMSFLSGNGFSGYVSAISPLSGLVDEYAGNIAYVAASSFTWVTQFLDQYKYIILACLVAMALAQYLLFGKLLKRRSARSQANNEE